MFIQNTICSKNKFKLIFFIFILLALSHSLYAQNADFSGSWETNWGTIVFKQKGNQVEGEYVGQYEGVITGTVMGKRLDFEWKQPEGQYGQGYFVLNGDDITGRWGPGKSNSTGGVWNGKRK